MSKTKKQLTSEDILFEIQEALIKEELAIPVYVSHIQQTLFWSGLTKEKQEKIVQSLMILEKESEGHVMLLKRVKELYVESIK